MKYIDKLSSKDLLFHYTKAETLIELIIPNKTLIYSNKESVRSPFEKIPNDSHISRGFIPKKEFENEVESFENRLSDKIRYIKKHLKNLKFACFCHNSKFNIKDSNFEKLGFAKPRMWDQYADNYKGGCLILSKKELQIKNDLSNQEIKTIEYKTFQEFKLKSQITFNIDNLYGQEELLNERVKELIEFHQTSQHVDYQDEQEVRIYGGQESKHLDIKDCIKGIIIFQNECHPNHISQLKNLSKKENIELYFISFDQYGLDVSNHNDIERYSDLLRKVFSK